MCTGGRELAQQPLLSNRANSEVVVPCYNVVDQRIDSRGVVVGWDGLNTKKKNINVKKFTNKYLEGLEYFGGVF